MAVSPVLEKFGRRIRLGVVGGGGNAMIGPVHRVAAQFDSHIEVVAGVLSSDPDRALQQAAAAGIARGYRNVPEMIAAERSRSDGIDAICVATPTDSHAHFVGMALDAGLDVICDKPLTNDVASALEIAKRVKASDRVLVLTHNYAGYPMVREARATVAAGELGPIRVVHVTYFQGSLGSRVEERPELIPSRLAWRLDPGKGGESHVMGDIGTHAHQLLTYVTGQNVTRVLADVGAALPGRKAHDTGSVILSLSGGARGMLFVTKAATGAENALSLDVYGEEGGLHWAQSDPNALRFMRNGRPAEMRTRGLPTLHPAARRATRMPPGHPEGFYEAFANIYADFAELVAARRLGIAPDPLACDAPDVAAGIAGLQFIDACLESTRKGGWVDCK